MIRGAKVWARALALAVVVAGVIAACASSAERDLGAAASTTEQDVAAPTVAPTMEPTATPTDVPEATVAPAAEPAQAPTAESVTGNTTASDPTASDPTASDPTAVNNPTFNAVSLADGWTEIEHVAGPGEQRCMCSDGSDYRFFVNAPPIADPNKVMLLFEGGGACWDAATCNPALGAYKTSVIEDRTTYAASDLPAGGIWDRSREANPFADWTLVFAPYCTGDVHLGTRTADYGDLTVEHKGAINAAAVMGWVVQEHGDAQHLFVTGSSAGSIPAPLYAGVMADRMPNAQVGHLSDASGAYPSVAELNAELGGTWGAIAGLPEWDEFDGLAPEEFSLPGLFTATRQHNPELTLARYDNAYDSVQSLFLLLNGLAGGDAVLDGIRSVEVGIEAEVGEIPSYVAPGQEHTILSGSRFYTEAVPGPNGDDVAFADWVSMLVAGEAPADVVCQDCRR